MLRVATHYGLEKQKTELMIDIYHLIDSLAELNYNSMNFSNNLLDMIERVTEAIADVQMKLEQIKVYWSIEDDEVLEIIENKMDYILGGIDEELLRSTTGTRSSKEQTENIEGEKGIIF